MEFVLGECGLNGDLMAIGRRNSLIVVGWLAVYPPFDKFKRKQQRARKMYILS